VANPLGAVLVSWRRGRDERRFFSRGPGPRFHGVYATRQDALAAIRPPKAAGYDHAEVTTLNFERMCRVALWDYPVLFALRRLLPHHAALLDAGGHMGTKYRAFVPLLPELAGKRWTVWDLPAMVAEGERRARGEGLVDLHFTSDLASVGRAHELLLGSGLLQYLELPFEALLATLPSLPRAIIVNKVAVHDGAGYFTLENLDHAAVPYQVRNEAQFLAPLLALGYRVTDRWEIPELSLRIPHHDALGATRSIGTVLERD
jgi:putative methyltransferase (TIGR04325 family)